jgi:hypothetical protein
MAVAIERDAVRSIEACFSASAIPEVRLCCIPGDGTQMRESQSAAGRKRVWQLEGVNRRFDARKQRTVVTRCHCPYVHTRACYNDERLSKGIFCNG